MSKLKRIKSPSGFQIIFAGFLTVILIGALILTLPISSRQRVPTSFTDALFTATSAVCVTGLVVLDTATHWSVLGQTVIIVLIQIGGLGVITVAAAFAMATGKKLGLKDKGTMQDALGAPDVGGTVKLTKFILKGTFIIESVGAVLMMPVFCRDFGIKGIPMSVFHSISAFCNAGFDLLGTPEAKFVSLTEYANDPLINITVMLLILIGGIGFITWSDILKHGIKFSRYRMQSKIVITATLALILLPSLYFFFFEFENSSLGERILLSLFQTVTPRTAGFNTAELTSISDVGIFIMTALMLIGGASGSTAGGMKISTFVIVLATAISVFRRKDEPEMFRRKIDTGTVKNAIAVFVMYITLFTVGSLAISSIENLPLLPCFYETASALATVGLTLGITPMLSLPSKLILTVLMFTGRVGGLTIIYAALSGGIYKKSKYPAEQITIG